MADKKQYYYIYVSKDKYELPIAVAESPSELARMIGKTAGSVMSMLSKGYRCYKKVEKEADDYE